MHTPSPHPRLSLASLLITSALLAIGCTAPAPDSNESDTASQPTPATQPQAEPATPEPLRPLSRGIDVSGHTHEVDWQQVADAGYDFAFAKATEGVDLEDPQFASNWQAMAEAGLVRGSYHFYVTEDDPNDQAAFFIQTVTLEPGDLVPVVDVELIGHGTQTDWVDNLRIFLRLIEEHYGVTPMIYTSPSFWEAHLDDSFGSYPLWIAEYGVDEPTLPAGWERWALWQHTQSAEVPGVPNGADEGADLNRVHPEVELERLYVVAEASSDG